MFKNKKHPHLVCTAGTQVGKTYALKKGEWSIGSHKKCKIRTSGDYVSELHTVISQNASGEWTLSNNSPNGTYVNQQRVDNITLEDFSIIQIGSENSFEFQPLGYSKSKLSDDHQSYDDSNLEKKRKSSKWHWVVAGAVLFYLPLFLYLKNLGDDLVNKNEASVMTLSGIETVSDQSRDFLLRLSSAVQSAPIGFESAGVRTMSLYDRLVTGSYSGDSEKDALIEEIVDKSKTKLALAHHYVQMNLDMKAIDTLKEAMAMVPDHRNPSTGYAAKAVASLTE